MAGRRRLSLPRPLNNLGGPRFELWCARCLAQNRCNLVRPNFSRSGCLQNLFLQLQDPGPTFNRRAVLYGDVDFGGGGVVLIAKPSFLAWPETWPGPDCRRPVATEACAIARGRFLCPHPRLP